ncbi:2348_t:CDS:2 [Entrophospora sp. SA101]|nr:2348_t:CDS:2 [Entrophospora sp. SA101]
MVPITKILILFFIQETNFTGSALIQNNQNAKFTDFTHGNLAHDNLNQQGSFNGDSVGPMHLLIKALKFLILIKMIK